MLNAQKGGLRFLEENFSEDEVEAAINTLHKRKACGFDAISTEHLVYGGRQLVSIITLVYNHILRLEYIPINMRRGIQIPLFKGKGACCLEADNYRGISLLTNFNKVYEVLLWNRIKHWWVNDRVISELQGAGKKRQSCVHTALLLQESIATALERSSKVFVTFLDVSKAYDTVWTDGLFYQLNEMGIKGKLWRLMYRAYVNFESRVRIENKSSAWFPMRCGIHQGGFLSLTKYVAFINSLLITLEESKLCCTISKIPSSPVGYADDVATACISKLRTDKVLQIVHSYGCKWRFNFNAKKSAILVYGETKRENCEARKFRMFKMGSEKVNERLEYDHVGVKACTLNDNERVAEKISKGRRVLNATSGLGIRKNGLSMRTCNLIFWTIVIPTLTFGCEIWLLSDRDIEKIQNFQKFAGRRLQRFPKRSPSSTSFYGLGWIRIETLIQIKKLLFLLTLIRMGNSTRLGMVFRVRFLTYMQHFEDSKINKYNSPIFELLNTGVKFGLFKMIFNMYNGEIPIVPKNKWSKMVWSIGWRLDDTFWESTAIMHTKNDLLMKTIGNAQYITWWHLADVVPGIQGMCETMAKLVCHASRLKEDDFSLIGSSHSERACSECDLNSIESVKHMVMQCPSNEGLKADMLNEIVRYDRRFLQLSENNPDQIFYWLMGKVIDGLEPDAMNQIWIIAGCHICNMYKHRLSIRKGVG